MATGSTTTAKRRAKRRSTLAFTWRNVALKITVTEDCWSPGQTQLELSVIKPKGAPVPITSTGYRCHDLTAELLAANGGAIAFFTDWFDREARTKAWQQTEFRWRQGDLSPSGSDDRRICGDTTSRIVVSLQQRKRARTTLRRGIALRCNLHGNVTLNAARVRYAPPS